MAFGPPVALDPAGGVFGEVAAGDEEVAQPPQRRQVRADRDLAQRALLHEVALVRLDVGLDEVEAARRPLRADGVVALELVERPPVGPRRLGALFFEVLGDERVEAIRELGGGQAERVGHGEERRKEERGRERLWPWCARL